MYFMPIFDNSTVPFSRQIITSKLSTKSYIYRTLKQWWSSAREYFSKMKFAKNSCSLVGSRPSDFMQLENRFWTFILLRENLYVHLCCILANSIDRVFILAESSLNFISQ